MKITVMLRDNGACGYYRIRLPYKTLEANTDHDIRWIERGDASQTIEHSLFYNEERDKFEVDVLVVPRLDNPVLIRKCHELQRDGTKVIADFDDNMFEVDPYSSHFKDLGAYEFTTKINGKTIEVYKDGVEGFNLKNNRMRLAHIAAGIKAADLVTVTQPILAKEYMRLNTAVSCLPNCIDPGRWQKLPLKRSSDEIRLFWTGGSSHYVDWTMLAEVWPVLFSKYKNLKLVIGGQKFDGTLKGVPREKLEFHPWTPVEAHHLKCAILDPDIAIIPLQDNKFNACKSSLKWVEMSALGIPSVVSMVSPYKEDYNGKNAIMVENNTVKGWIDGISLLVEDSILRQTIAGEANRYVLERYDIHNEYWRWEEALTSLANQGVAA